MGAPMHMTRANVSASRTEAAWALVALGLILVLTLGWWALALWPLPDNSPEWLLRTREICFGNPADGLPLPGGWILLLGQPIGMFAVLFTVWGGAVRKGLNQLRESRGGRILIAGVS